MFPPDQTSLSGVRRRPARLRHIRHQETPVTSAQSYLRNHMKARQQPQSQFQYGLRPEPQVEKRHSDRHNLLTAQFRQPVPAILPGRSPVPHQNELRRVLQIQLPGPPAPAWFW